MAERRKKGAAPKDRSRAAVASELKSWCAEHGALNASMLLRTDEPLYTAVRRRFGGLDNAAKELGLPYNARHKRISSEEVIERIRQRQAKGLPLHAGAVGRSDRRLYYHARQRFGSWAAAVKASGLAAAGNVKREYSVASLKEELEGWIKEHGPLNATALRRSAPRLLAAVEHRYGSVPPAAKALGLPCQARMRRWAPERIIHAILQRTREEKSLVAARVREDDRSLYNAGLRYFGSWRRAVAASGVSYEKIGLRPAWTEESIGQELRLAYQALGPLAAKKLSAYDCGLCLAAVRRYGSVQKAAQRFGLPYGGRRMVRR